VIRISLICQLFLFSLLLLAQPAFADGLDNPFDKKVPGNPEDLGHDDLALPDFHIHFGSDEEQSLGSLSHTNINPFAPMDGFADIISGKVYADQVKEFIDSALPTSLIALNLTEPAVGAGMAAAMQHANSSVHSRYLAEQHLVNQASANPQTRQMILEAYNGCVHRHITNQMGWAQAQSKCMRERTKAASNFDSVGDKPEDGFKFFDSPNHNDENEPWNTTVVNYIFNFLTQAAQGNTTLKDEIDKKRVAFLKEFGDVELELKQDNEGNKSTLTTKRIAPTSSPKDVYKDLVHNKYAALLTLMKGRCDRVSETDSFHDAFHPTKNAYSAFWVGFYEEGNNKDLFATLSIEGFGMSAIVLDELYARYVNLASTDADNNPECQPLLTAKPLTALDPSVRHEDFTDWERLYFDLAKRLAQGRRLARYREAERYIRPVTDNSDEMKIVRDFALGAIYSVAQTTNIRAAEEHNLNNLYNWVATSLSVRAFQSGRKLGMSGRSASD